MRVFVRRNGLLLGAEGYLGEPALIIEWTADIAELRRREDAAWVALGLFDLEPVSRTLRRA